MDRWIKRNFAEPTQNGRYLVLYDQKGHRSVEIADYTTGNRRWWLESGEGDPQKWVTHWMPLPEMPKGE